MATTKAAPGKKGLINFDFLQKLGKVLMTVIAVMPAAGLMISLGKLVQMGGGDIAAVMTIGTTMENIGWAVINNLHILFAVAIGGSWAKERAGGAFAAVLAFALINVITGNIFGVTSAMLADPNAVTHTLFGQEIAVNGYFTSVLGAPALNMGVFVGIIAGFVGGVAYNKYYNFRKLPDALAFFNGKRFVPMVVIGYSVVISILLSLFWPVVQTGINNFGIWIANSSETSPVLAPFIYGTLERLLLPFGLHHMLTIPMNYTSFGGTYTIATGVNAGSQVFGQDPLWLAWANDLINFKKTGDMAAYNNLLQLSTLHTVSASAHLPEFHARRLQAGKITLLHMPLLLRISGYEVSSGNDPLQSSATVGFCEFHFRFQQSDCHLSASPAVHYKTDTALRTVLEVHRTPDLPDGRYLLSAR